jgi:glycosyltransferase involved in cell wall biosynthesis
MKISVVIPTYNEEEVIEKCLQSLSKQSYKDLELILVDDGSTDNTKIKIQNAKSKFKGQNLILMQQQHLGPGAARNLGAKKAKGEILVFVDADMSFSDTFIEKLVEPIVKGKVKGTFSKDEFVANWENVWARCWNVNENWASKKRHPENYPDRQKVFRAILKSEFDKVGGFEPGGYTDDYSLAKKLGYEALVASGAVFYHNNPDNLAEVYRQAKWSAKREYKLGMVGYFVALVRASFPVSITLGFIKSITRKEPAFIVFKIIYDLGVFVGILQYLLTGNKTK